MFIQDLYYLLLNLIIFLVHVLQGAKAPLD